MGRAVASSQRTRVQRPAGSKPSDFSDECVGRQVVLILDGETAVESVVLEARRHWFKVRDSSGRTVYVNKAFVEAIEVPK